MSSTAVLPHTWLGSCWWRLPSSQRLNRKCTQYHIITGQACNGLHYLYAFDIAFHDFYPLQCHLIMIEFATYMNSWSLTSKKLISRWIKPQLMISQNHKKIKYHSLKILPNKLLQQQCWRLYPKYTQIN